MPVPGWTTQTNSVTGVGNTPSVKILSPTYSGLHLGGFLQPTIGVNVSGSVTATAQWSGDDWTVPGYSDATANWFPFTTMTSLTAAASATIGAAMTMVRVSNAAGSTGTTTISVCQQSN